MNKKEEAVQELFDGFLTRFGDTPLSRKAIKENISHLVRSKSRITVKDIDHLERKIKQDVIISCNSPPHAQISTCFKSKTPKSMRINYKEKSANVRDHSLIQDHSEQSPVRDFSIRASFLSRVKLKHQIDKWGKKIKDDTMKYYQEQEALRTQLKQNQRKYFDDLFKQTCWKKQKTLLGKNQETGEKDFADKLSTDIGVREKEAQQQKLLITSKQKQFLESFMEERSHEKSKLRALKHAEKEAVNKEIMRFYIEEGLVRSNKLQKLKELSEENNRSLSQIKNSKMTEKKESREKDKEHLHTIAKTLNDSELKYQKIVTENREKAHNIERLEKLMMVRPKGLKELEEEARLKEKQRVEEVEKEHKLDLRKKIEAKTINNREIADALERQVSDKKLRAEINKSLDLEQGLISKLEDEKTHLEDLQKKKKKKQLQTEMGNFYYKQIQEKLQNELDELEND